jgi:hypothetical protein
MRLLPPWRVMQLLLPSSTKVLAGITESLPWLAGSCYDGCICHS